MRRWMGGEQPAPGALRGLPHTERQQLLVGEAGWAFWAEAPLGLGGSALHGRFWHRGFCGDDEGNTPPQHLLHAHQQASAPRGFSRRGGCMAEA